MLLLELDPGDAEDPEAAAVATAVRGRSNPSVLRGADLRRRERPATVEAERPFPAAPGGAARPYTSALPWEDLMKRLSFICLLSVFAVLAEGCSNGDGGNVSTGTGGGAGGTGGAGNSTGTGGSAGNSGTGSGGKGAGGTGGSAGTTGKGGAAGSGSAGTSGGGAGGARGGAGGGTSQACGSGNPCAVGKVCVSYNCGPLGNLGGCTAPPPACIDNPCDGGVCASCPPTVCRSFGGNCFLADPADIMCVMPG